MLPSPIQNYNLVFGFQDERPTPNIERSTSNDEVAPLRNLWIVAASIEQRHYTIHHIDWQNAAFHAMA